MTAANTDTVGWCFDNTYTRLPQEFYAAASPALVAHPQLCMLNTKLAGELGLDLCRLAPDESARLFAGQDLPPGSQPIAQAYAGHQYGHFTMLGDGRAILLGEHRTPSGMLVDIQLKGAGATSYSRRGDGRAALGPMLREYLVSEAMFALGIPTTRSLAVVATGEPVYRATPQRGAILTRVAASHLRVGTFEYIANRQNLENLKQLADYAIARHTPELIDANDRHLAFLNEMIERQASLIARWQLVGFIHGVMNTDNMSISGETIDYGPCAFMNAYHPDTVYSSIDHRGRYAYGNQPAIAQWNLARLAEALLPLLDENTDAAVAIAVKALEDYTPRFQRHWETGMGRKLGLSQTLPGDSELIAELLSWMQETQADFTNTFRDLSREPARLAAAVMDTRFQVWRATWEKRLLQENGSRTAITSRMQGVNPYVIPRNHLVEEALSAAEERDDLTVLQRLLAVLASPFQYDNVADVYQQPSPNESEYRTFCGT